MFDAKTLSRLLEAHIAKIRSAPKDGGYTTETVVITAALVLLALAVVGIIVGKVTNKAKGIDLG
ncbi:hypothetical protein [Streptomyces sp. NPDC093097]|uniref:hypothetical protein n=1 Tax=Streptomyces sp. NPDC093097 TaxID=3366027 RepID=UPI00380EECDA